MEFFRQEYWSELPFPSLRNLPNPGIKPGSPTLQADTLLSEPPEKPDGSDSWTRKKAEHWRIDAFELWCWRRLLRVPWTARRSNQSILKEINPEYSLRGWMLKLKLSYFGHLMQRTDSLEKTLMLGKIEGRRRRGWQRMTWEAWRAAVHGVTKSRSGLSNWTDLNWLIYIWNICYFLYLYLYIYLLPHHSSKAYI